MNSYAVTDIGMVRGMNQDDYYESSVPVGNLPNLFLVADGMGGHNAGEYASRQTVETVVAVSRASAHTQPAAILKEAICRANEEIIRKAMLDASMFGMGTTVVGASIADGRLFAANVGDSRLYVINEEIRQVTRDHSFVEEMVRRGELDREASRTHPDKNIITRAVGAMSEIQIDFFEEELCPGDEVLLCSDGLTNMLEDDQIRSILKGHREIEGKAVSLIEAANRNGGKDNITVIVIAPFS